MATEYLGGSPIADDRFRQFAERLPVALAIWTGDGISYANAACLALTGRSSGELRHLPLTSLLAEESRASVAAQRRDLMSGAVSTARTESLLLGGGGTPVLTELVMTPLESGDTTDLLVTLVDRSDRRRAEEGRALAEQRHQQLFEHDLTAIAWLTPAGIILEGNRALGRLFAVDSPEALFGRPFAEFVQDPLYLTELVAKVRVEGSVEAVELQARRADGEVIVVGGRLTGSFDPSGQLTSIQLLLVEMTDRKRLEAYLIGVQRTEAVGRLAGGLAHDFNNLLTVVGGHSDYLLQTLATTDPRHASAQAIQQASHRAAALTRQLLAFGRRQVFHLREVDIRRLLEDAQPMLARVAGDRVTLQITVEDAAPNVNVDPVQLEQVLVNLALNARDALGDGGTLTIRVDLMAVTDRPPSAQPWIRRGSYLRIDMVDSGPGMDLNACARVFEPFYTTKQLGRGNGLGLATVYGIVKQSDGYIWVESEMGRGTTFTMLLPAWTETARVAPAPRHDAKAAGVPSETVLLVERDDSLRAMLADALRRRGYHVLDADSADRAAALFDAHAGRVALVVADIQHADGSGTAIAERLRASEPKLRVLYMSATTTMSPSQSARSGFIQKPFSLQAFADQVRQTLDSVSEQ